jgi:PPOX class probable F420-dependent enzyme
MPGRLTKPQRERFLRGRYVAVLTTLGADGTPVPTPIWYLYRDGSFYFRTASNAVKAENVRRDPRVSICVQDERAPYKAVVAYGRAQIDAQQAWLDREIPRHYLGFIGAIGYERTAREAVQQGPEIALIVRPDRWSSFDFAAETPLVGRLWLFARRFLPPWL